jgi:hypothetical protein
LLEYRQAFAVVGIADKQPFKLDDLCPHKESIPETLQEVIDRAFNAV